MTADVVDSAKERKELLLLLQYAEQKEREREKKGEMDQLQLSG